MMQVGTVVAQYRNVRSRVTKHPGARKPVAATTVAHALVPIGPARCRDDRDPVRCCRQPVFDEPSAQCRFEIGDQIRHVLDAD